MSSHRRNALLALTLTGIIWGATVPLSKLALGWLDPLWLSVARFGVAAPLLLVLPRAALRGTLTPSVLACGALFYAGAVSLQNLGIATTSVSHAALILGAMPVLVALLAVAAGQGSASRLAWLGFACALAGVALVTGGGDASGEATLAGDLLVLASTFGAALFIVAQARLLRGRDPLAVTVVQMTAGAAVGLPFALAAEGVPGAPDAPALWSFLALALAGSLVPFALYAWAQARVAPEVAGAFANLEPLVGAALGALAFHEPFGSLQALGCAAILLGIMLSVEREQGPGAACPA